MEKISGIIPSSARVTKVDLSDAPGTRSTLPNADRSTVTTLSESMPGTPAWKSKEARQAALVNDVSNSFFMKNKPEPENAAESAPLKQPDGLFPKGSFIDRSA